MPRAELFQSPRGSCSKRTVGTIEVQHTATTSCVIVALVLRILQAMEIQKKRIILIMKGKSMR